MITDQEKAERLAVALENALELMLTGKDISATQILSWGIQFGRALEKHLPKVMEALMSIIYPASQHAPSSLREQQEIVFLELFHNLDNLESIDEF